MKREHLYGYLNYLYNKELELLNICCELGEGRNLKYLIKLKQIQKLKRKVIYELRKENHND